MKILSAFQIRLADSYTIENEPIASIDLMERSCEAFVSAFTELYPEKNNVGIVAGFGNNGGDGLGIARKLKQKGYKVQVWLLATESLTTDGASNLARLKGQVPVIKLNHGSSMPDFSGCAVLVDALFGMGLNRPVTGFEASVIQAINASNKQIVAVDTPSGLYSDEHTGNHPVVKSHWTLTFQAPKLAFMMPENGPYVGQFKILDIGLHADYLAQAESYEFFTLEEEIHRLIKKRQKFSHKGHYGKALIVGGSLGKIGAVHLAAKACLKSGAGLVTAYVPRCGVIALQTSLPELMVYPDKGKQRITNDPSLGGYDVLGIGVGMGRHSDTGKVLKGLLKKSVSPVVLDADALNHLAENQEWMKLIPKNSILTPHSREFDRLAGKSSNDFEVLEKLRLMSVTYSVYVIYKGAHTCIATPQGTLHFNSTGNPGMATAGSGDVLTGILTGLLAQGYYPFEACKVGVMLHGLAGDFASEKSSEESIIASDIVSELGPAFKRLHQVQ